MGDPDMAALDPIFWLHHCNIDRLWAVWLDKGDGRVNPSETQWLDQTFAFHDENGAQESRPVSDFLDTTQVGYMYEGIPAPVAAEEILTARGRGADPAMPDPEMVGASERPLMLTGTPTSVDVSIDRRAVEARARDRDRAEAAAPQHVYLNLEDIDAEHAPAVVYEVYITADAPSLEAPRYIGNVSFFGIEHVGHANHDAGASIGAEAVTDTWAQLIGWAVMVTAMMVPLVWPAVRHVGLNSLRWRRQRAIAVFLAAYTGVWTAFGAVVLGARDLLSVAHAPALAAALAVAALWQLSPLQRRFRRACHRTVPLPPRGLQAVAGDIRFGLRQGVACIGVCWPLMLAMALVPGAILLWMVALTAAMASAKLLPRSYRPSGPLAVCLGVAAATTLVLTVG